MRLLERLPAQLVTLAVSLSFQALSLMAQEPTPEQKARRFGEMVGGCLDVVIAVGVAIAIIQAVSPPEAPHPLMAC